MVASQLLVSHLVIKVTTGIHISLKPTEELNMLRLPKSFLEFFIRSLKAVPYLAVVFGPVFALIGLWESQSTKQFLSESKDVQAIVLRIDEQVGEKGRVYRPTFEVTDEGQKVEYTGNLWTSPKPHNVGDIVRAKFQRSSGKIMSERMIQSSKNLSESLLNLGVFSFILGICYFARRWWLTRTRAKETEG